MNYLRGVIILLCLVALTTSRSQYRVVNVNKNLNTIQLFLRYTGTDEYYGNAKNAIIKDLKFTFHVHAFYDFYIKITDVNKARYQVPQKDPWPIDPLGTFSYPINLCGVSFQYTSSPFDFKITRKINNAIIFSTYESDFMFSDYLMQIGTQVDTPYIYGLGQRFSTSFRKTDGKWTIFNRDRGQCEDNGVGKQTYGYYPVYFAKQNNQHFHFNYLRNSNAMDVIVKTLNNKTYVQYKVIGGVFDFRFLLSQTNPQIALEKWNLFIGNAAIPPFWSFGMHQCRWGYKNSSMLKDVIKGYENNDIPLDTIWSDIDYMVDYQDFTIDEDNFPLSDMRGILSKYNYIPIVDAGIKVNDGFAYIQGKKKGVFVKTANGDQYRGKVWPGMTTFVDFLHPEANTYWSNMLDVLYNKVKFSGVWLDMNEYANFCDGTCEGITPVQSGGFDYSKDLPYQPGQDNIQSHTISLNASHYNNTVQANVHAFGGMLQTYATNRFLLSKGKRPFIISRSSTLGSHKYGFHWTGDNYAEWSYLKGSIADIFNFQLYGTQMVGPDVCGFGGNTTEELCARWFQLASLYPFIRDHNDNSAKSQQPYALGPIVIAAARKSLKFRYSILKHYYTIFVAKKGLGSIFKPLFFAFPNDNNAYYDQITDTQFMIGVDLLAAPILEPNTTSRKVYFPSGYRWYDFFTGKLYLSGTQMISNASLTQQLPLFLRQGTALLKQDSEFVRQTKDLGNIFQLVAGFKFDSQRSTADVKYYRSDAAILSIKDYNDDTKVNQCISQGCLYNIGLLLRLTPTTRTLQFDISFIGAFGLNQLIVIDKVTLYYDDIQVSNSFVNPIQIAGPNKIVVPINQPTLQF